MTYPGGKNAAGIYQTIICQMPPHTLYAEPFLGSGAVMRRKRPAAVNIGIDRDSGAVDAFVCRIPSYQYKLVQGDGLGFLQWFNWQGTELVYCDPPYLIETRRSRGRIYKYEFSDDDHRRLLDIVLTIPAMVMLSGYYSEMYAERLAAWRSIQFKAMTRAGKPATEWLWMNFPEPTELHDYRFLGTNRIDRQRIKRKCDQLGAKLSKLPRLERAAVLDSINRIKS